MTTRADIMSALCTQITKPRSAATTSRLACVSFKRIAALHMGWNSFATWRTLCHQSQERSCFTALRTWNFFRTTAIYRLFLQKMLHMTSENITVVESSTMGNSRTLASLWVRTSTCSSQCSRPTSRLSSLGTTKSQIRFSWATSDRCRSLQPSATLHPLAWTRWLAEITSTIT